VNCLENRVQLELGESKDEGETTDHRRSGEEGAARRVETWKSGQKAINKQIVAINKQIVAIYRKVVKIIIRTL